MKRLTAFILVMALIASFMPLQSKTVEAKTKKPRLSKWSISLTTDSSPKTIKVKNTKQKVKWSVSKKRIIRIDYAYDSQNHKIDICGLRKGKTTLIAKIGKIKLACKVTVRKSDDDDDDDTTSYTKPKTTPTPTPTATPVNYTANFDKVVAHVKSEGKFSSTGAYCTYGRVSVSTAGDTIEFFEGSDREGSSVKITRNSSTAIATVILNVGTATASFNISQFKGDTTDKLSWSNSPSQANQLTYDTAIANIMKNIQQNAWNWCDHVGLKGLGFTSYAF